MGVKRPFDEETIQELSFKQAKQLDENMKPMVVSENTSPHGAFEKTVIPGDPEIDGEVGNDEGDKALDYSTPLSWVTSSSSEEGDGRGGSYDLPLYPDLFEFNIPRRAPIQYEDAYSFVFNGSPRKEVPVGPDHQADVPEWDPNASDMSIGSDYIADDENYIKLAGTSIIPMPDSFKDDDKIGHIRLDCDCLDKCSIRCVRQHVEEERGRLREILGKEKFAELGFLDMGEEVALNWTEEEEWTFNEVIYSNPVSLGKNFWKCLSAVFSSRKNMELISYYFNVFILRRRAVQNRCDYLDTDSDDDEWQGDGRPPEVGGEDDDSGVESFGDEDNQVDHEMGWSYGLPDDNEDDHDNDYDDDDDDNNDDGDGDGDGAVGTNGGDGYENGDQEEPMSKQQTENSINDSDFYTRASNMGKDSKEHDAQTIIFSQRHPFMMVSCGSEVEEPTLEENGYRSENRRCLSGKVNGTSNSFGSGFLLEATDAKAWDDDFSTNYLKSIDLLPTCSMIEEIFGPCACKRS